MNLVADDILRAFPYMVPMTSPSGAQEPCYQDRDLRGALGIAISEGLILHRLVQLHNPSYILEIGSYVGWSAAFSLFETQAHMVCVDPFKEGNGTVLPQSNMAVRDRFWENLTRLGVHDRVHLVIDESPACLPTLALPRSRGYGLVFVDGWHFDGQPEKDVIGVLPLLSPTGIVVLHDTWMPDVQRAAHALIDRGWHIHTCPTPNYLAIAWRKAPVWWLRFTRELSCG